MFVAVAEVFRVWCCSFCQEEDDKEEEEEEEDVCVQFYFCAAHNRFGCLLFVVSSV